jgi:hypothetical protein
MILSLPFLADVAVSFPMDAEELLLTGLSVVTSALCFAFKKLWERSQQCEDWRKEKEPILMRMEKMLGLAEGTLSLVDTCHVQNCPFAGKMPGTFAVEDNKKTKKL